MSLTSHRVLQWLVILLLIALFGGAYWYWSVRGATKFGTDRANEKVLGALVGYWPFDGGDVSYSDLTAADRSGGGNNGTLTNFDPPQPSTSGLVGLWPMDTADISSATVYDRSGSGNNGTFPDGGMSATGGTITTSGGYTIHTFTGSGTFTVTSGSGNVEYLVVAGGGGGGGRRWWWWWCRWDENSIRISCYNTSIYSNGW